jgi:hypothetical protein
MNGSQAVNCLKELSPFERRISFERDSKSSGYIIRIEGLTYESDRALVRQVAKSLNLTVREDADSISIF